MLALIYRHSLDLLPEPIYIRWGHECPHGLVNISIAKPEQSVRIGHEGIELDIGQGMDDHQVRLGFVAPVELVQLLGSSQAESVRHAE